MMGEGARVYVAVNAVHSEGESTYEVTNTCKSHRTQHHNIVRKKGKEGRKSSEHMSPSSVGCKLYLEVPNCID